MLNESTTRGEEAKVNSYAEQAIHALLTDRPIAYHPVLARAVKSVTGGIFLSQLLYWTPRSRDPEGWIRKTQEEITSETALTRREQETAREACKQAGVLEWKLRGVPAKLHYRVDIRTIAKLLASKPPLEPVDADQPNDGHPPQPAAPAPPEGARKQARRNAPTKFGGKRQTDLHDPAKQGRADPPSNVGGSRQRITETTSEITTETVVVDALRARGISGQIAEQLATAYDVGDILVKCEVLDWLVASGSRQVGRNPAGYLRRSIEQDYAPPPGYKSSAQQDAEEAERAAAIAAREAALRAQVEEEQRAHALDLADVQRRYPPQPIPGTELTTEAAWSQALAKLEQILSGPNFAMFLSRTVLLACDGHHAQIGAPRAFDVEQLTTRLDRHVTPVLSEILGASVQCTYVSLVTLLTEEDEPSTARPDHSPSRHRHTRPAVPTGGRA